MRAFSILLAISILVTVNGLLIKSNHFWVLAAIDTLLVATFLYRDLFIVLNPRRRPAVTKPRLASEFGTVTIETDNLGGTVDILGTIWPAKSDRRLQPGTEIRVIGSSGGTLFVDAR